MKNGDVSMISADVVAVNEIASNIALKIQEELNKNQNNHFYLRLGSLTGTKYLAGIGPNIKINLETVGTIDTELKSFFEAKGINQTVHKMYLQIECTVSILTPYKIVEDKIENQILLSECVIVGTTPNTYFGVE